jgi:hypothetical protein
MEQPCYKCGQTVEQGIPFCSHCGAPQIRVAIPESPQEPAAATKTEIDGQLVETVQGPGIPGPLHWARVLQPCALAALLADLAMFLGLAFPAAVLGAGFLAVALYRRRTPGTVRAGMGAKLGAISGILCFGLSAIFVALAATVPDFRVKIRGQILEGAKKWAAARPADPQVQAALEQLKTPEGLATMLIIGSVLFLVLFVAVASLGGALGGAILSRQDRS